MLKWRERSFVSFKKRKIIESMGPYYYYYLVIIGFKGESYTLT